MIETPNDDWDPRSATVLEDQIAAYDDLRQRCPVAHSKYLNWSLFKHQDVMRALQDHEPFSNAVSKRSAVPNGMDPPEHTLYRRIVEPYFNASRMQAFEPTCRKIAIDLMKTLPDAGEIEVMYAFAEDFALQVQCAFLGWPPALHEPLRQWTRRNREATLAGDRAALEDVAYEFDGYIKALLEERRNAGINAPDDITSSLLRERVGGRLIDDEEIVSILRNWTVGELSTISASIGILAHYLAARPDLQQQLREQTSLLPAAIDEILRIHAPLIASRRIVTEPVEISGCALAAGERVTLMWASANRDEAIFGDPDEFRLDRDPAENLLYGAGVHVCPGAPLARMELLVIIEELLKQYSRMALVRDKESVKAAYPASGFSSLPIWIQRQGLLPNFGNQ